MFDPDLGPEPNPICMTLTLTRTQSHMYDPDFKPRTKPKQKYDSDPGPETTNPSMYPNPSLGPNLIPELLVRYVYLANPPISFYNRTVAIR